MLITIPKLGGVFRTWAVEIDPSSPPVSFGEEVVVGGRSLWHT